MRTKLALAAACGLAFAAVPATAFAPAVQTTSSYTIGIRGFVPVICRASLNATTALVDAGVQQLGALNEFCNSPNGYKVEAHYSPNLASATLLIDGVPVTLDNGGSVVVSHSSYAAITSRSVALDLAQPVQGGSISFRIQPL